MPARRVVAAAALAGFGVVSPTVADGQRIYEQVCAGCHGADGTDAMPGVPDLTERDGVLRKPDAVLLRNTIKGVARPRAMAMPARGGSPALTDDELRAALAYIRRTFGESTTKEKRSK